MKILLRFIKPYTGLCICTLIVMVLDAAGGLLIPSITAAMINSGISGARMEYLIQNASFCKRWARPAKQHIRRVACIFVA